MTDPLTTAADAHRAARAAQQAMRDLSRERDAAVMDARAAGITVKELQEALGVNRHRIVDMTVKAQKCTG